MAGVVVGGSVGEAVLLTGEDLTSYIYTDRPVYRPGHTVHFKGILRQLGGRLDPREAWAVVRPAAAGGNFLAVNAGARPVGAAAAIVEDASRWRPRPDRPALGQAHQSPPTTDRGSP